MFFRSRSLPIGSRSQGLRGLMNYGLSCCVNALLQSFSATWELVDLLEGWDPVDKESVPLYLREVLLAMQSDQSQPAPHQDFLHCLDRNYIRIHVQQDADEVFLSILNLIQQQMSDKVLAQEIQSLYKVTVETYLQCIECTYIKTGTSFLLSLPMHIRESHNSLEGCIRLFFELQELRDGDKCYCARCGEKKPSKQGFKLISLPPVLCLHLKRFRNSRGYTRKLYCKVTFPETLNISEILTVEALSESYVQSDSQYSLCAVIVHSGDAMFGHYTAYVRHKDQSWYYANDSFVRQVSWKEVQNTYGGSQREDTAYMLLYRQTPEGSNKSGPQADGAKGIKSGDWRP
uniref:Ubiquitin specific peptidase 18 n=1 Tax=Hucho hucho TaxID=62062 RepID=A0A4W5QD99_9TELE